MLLSGFNRGVREKMEEGKRGREESPGTHTNRQTDRRTASTHLSICSEEGYVQGEVGVGNKIGVGGYAKIENDDEDRSDGRREKWERLKEDEHEYTDRDGRDNAEQEPDKSKIENRIEET